MYNGNEDDFFQVYSRTSYTKKIFEAAINEFISFIKMKCNNFSPIKNLLLILTIFIFLQYPRLYRYN